MDDVALEGGCQCGAIRYRLTAKPIWIGHCHCRMCQRSHGAPVVTWAGTPPGHFEITNGTLRYYRSSDRARRGFCAKCGTHIAWVPDVEADEAPAIELALATFDHPETLIPTTHAWYDSAMPWLPIDDGLPRFPRGVAGHD